MQPVIRIHGPLSQPSPVVVGCPFPSDVEVGGGVQVVLGEQSAAAAQAAPLTGPTPGGVRWWELSFIAPADGEAVVRTGEVAPPEGGPLAREEEGKGVRLDNGLVKAWLEAAPGRAPVRVDWDGGQGTLVPRLAIEGIGECEEMQDAERTVAILRNGPIRAQVELKGTLRGPEGVRFDYRLTLEVWREMKAVRVDWMLTNLTPGRLDVTVRHATLQGAWEVGPNPARVFRQESYGPYFRKRDVVNPDGVTLVADERCSHVRVARADMLLDESTYPFYCAPPTVKTGEWLELQGETGRVSAQVVDFADTRPNALVSHESELSYQLVPDSTGLGWPQGRRKEQHLLLAFGATADETEPQALAGAAARVFTPGRAQPAPETLRALKCFELDRMLPFEPRRHFRLNGILNGLCSLETPATKWDVGDTPDWHYTRGYAGSAHQWFPLEGFESLRRRYKAGGGLIFPDAFKFFVEPVWTNNEYDMIHALATEVMRTGGDSHFRTLRWAARHNVEVDFVSYSDDPWHHRASPFHSHFHNRKGAITSHFWTQGLLQYYCLTGDRDAREVALALGDKIIEMNASAEVRTWNFDREIGWALLALSCLVEAGYDKYLAEARKIAEFLQGFDRGQFAGAVHLSAGKAGRSLERQMIDNAFGYSSMVEALDRYGKLAGDEALGEWFEVLLRQLKDALWERVQDGERVSARSMLGLVMTIGFERTDDPDFVTAGRLLLESYLDPAFPSAGDVPRSAGAEGGQAKPCAMAYRGLHRLLGLLDRMGELDRYDYAVLRERREND